MLHLNVTTPERAFLNEDCLSVSLPGRYGELQVLPGHTPCLIELKTGHVVYETKDRKAIRFMIASGFVEVDRDQVNILCEMARNKEEVDKVIELSLQQDLGEQFKKLATDDDEGQKRLNAEVEKNVAKLSLFD